MKVLISFGEGVRDEKKVLVSEKEWKSKQIKQIQKNAVTLQKIYKSYEKEKE